MYGQLAGRGRTMDIYSRQESLGINTNQKVCVVGIGGIGFHVAKMLAMSGVPELYLFDQDVFEEHNLNRIDLDSSVVGCNKAQVVAKLVEKLRPDAYVKFYPFKLSQVLFPNDIDWVVDCTDLQASQETNQNLAESRGVKYVKAGYNGLNISISDRIAEWGEAPDGYTIVPSWVVPAVIVASLTVGKVLKWQEKEMGCTMDKLYGYR